MNGNNLKRAVTAFVKASDTAVAFVKLVMQTKVANDHIVS
jgi:hypothetical protein